MPLAVALLLAPLAGDPPRPNLVVVLADDLGYSDLGCFGGEVRTPNLDRLAAEGVRLTGMRNFARCCPTRAALLTGRYPHEVGLRVNGRSLSPASPTIAELLGSEGYRTSMVGKWHLTQAEARPGAGGFADPHHLRWVNRQEGFDVPFGPLDTYPTARGFEAFYGIVWGVIHFNNPFSLVDGTEPVRELPEGFHLTDAIGERAAAEAARLAKGDEPFFLYVAHCAPHWPLHAPAETIAGYDGVYDDGWKALREARYARQLELGLFEGETHPLPPLDGAGDWDALSAEERAVQARLMQVHAAMVEQMDATLEALLVALEETGELDSTLVVFLADNGASPEVPREPGYDRPSALADGTPLVYGHDVDPEGIGSPTSYTGLGAPWASAVNTPYRWWKARSHEGGLHTPAIVWWPDGLALEAGSLDATPLVVQDVAATLLELAGAEPPEGDASRSFAPLLTKGEAPPPRVDYFEHQGSAAIRDGTRKLVRRGKNAEWELYDLAADATETRDLAGEEPDEVASLAKRWGEWFERMQRVEDDR